MPTATLKQRIAFWVCRLLGIDPQAEINRQVLEKALAEIESQLKIEGALTVLGPAGNIK